MYTSYTIYKFKPRKEIRFSSNIAMVTFTDKKWLRILKFLGCNHVFKQTFPSWSIPWYQVQSSMYKL